MEQKPTIYEQPLNEHIRVCLRLEYLLRCVKHYLKQDSSLDMHNAVIGVVNILEILDRPDLKSKLTNALRLHAMAMVHLAEAPEVDTEKLRKIMQQLDQFIDILHGTHGKLGQELRDNEFLIAIQQKLAIPGGLCDFDLPAYHLWSQQLVEQQQQDLRTWFWTFKDVQSIVDLLLKLARDSVKPEKKTAPAGFYQKNLIPENSYQMIRVVILCEAKIFPDISVGRHHLSIHFFKLNIAGRPIQVTNDVEFTLTCCKI